MNQVKININKEGRKNASAWNWTRAARLGTMYSVIKWQTLDNMIIIIRKSILWFYQRDRWKPFLVETAYVSLALNISTRFYSLLNKSMIFEQISEPISISYGNLLNSLFILWREAHTEGWHEFVHYNNFELQNTAYLIRKIAWF